MSLQEDLSAPSHEFLKIEPLYPFAKGFPSLHLQTVQQIVNSLFSPIFFKTFSTKELFFRRLNASLPIASFTNPLDDPSSTIAVTFLCPADYTHGVGRYITDSLSRWLIPGKQTLVTGKISLDFCFSVYPKSHFYLTQEMLMLPEKENRQRMRKSLSLLIKEIKLNIMAVYQARYIASLKSGSFYNKHLLLEENLSLLLNPLGDANENLFNQVHGILSNVRREEKLDEIKKNLTHLFNERPKIFDRSIFYEMTQTCLLFGKSFFARRNPRHVSRIIAYQYLFKKVIQKKAQKMAHLRHSSFKLIKGGLTDQKNVILGVLFGFNFVRETERFEFKNIMEAMRLSLPYLEYVPDSLIVDRKDEKIYLFYLEMRKKERTPFTAQEIRHLTDKLPSELVKQIDTSVHPVFMPRNEEELLRNLILLSKQIKYVRDLPQVSIHYDSQSDTELSFIVLIVKLLKHRDSSLKELLKQILNLRITLDDIRHMGYLKKKYPKEAVILQVSLGKWNFFRKDSSVDLLRARQKIVTELTKTLGEFRDYNGGILLKQEEALKKMRTAFALSSQEEELLLENYFYSLRPGIMQTVHDTEILKKHFLLMKELLARNLHANFYEIVTDQSGPYPLFFIKAIAPSFKRQLLNSVASLSISSHHLTSASLDTDQASLLGFILSTQDKQKISIFQETLTSAMKEWEELLACPTKYLTSKRQRYITLPFLPRTPVFDDLILSSDLNEPEWFSPHS